MRRLLIGLVLLGGCALYRDDHPPPPGDEGLEDCVTTRASYLIDTLTVPRDSTESNATAQDLDGDGTIDNRVGTLFGLLASMNLDVQGRAEDALAADAFPVVVTIDTCADPSATLFELHQGLDVDRRFDPPRVRIGDETAHPAVGPGSGLQASGGQSRFPVVGLFDLTHTRWIDGWNLSFELAASSADRIEGRLALGLDGETFFAESTEAMLEYVEQTIAETPGCPSDCEPDSPAASMMSIFDENQDDVITLDELRQNSLIQTFTRPDLDLLTIEDGEQVYWPSRDGEVDTISFGVGFEATAVEVF
jgi:hypothetical protein